MAQCCISFFGSPAALPIPSKANLTPSCMTCLTLVSKRSVKIRASETKSNYRTYQALLRGGEEMSAVLKEMAELLEDVSGLDKETEFAAIEMAATASIVQRLEKLDGSFMMALDFMISQTAKEHDEKKMQLLEVVKQSVLAQLDQKAPSQVQLVGLLCKTPKKEHRHHILRCASGGGGACDKEDGEKLIVPAGNLNEIANQADDLIISMEEKPAIPDRKLLAKLVLAREEARSMMGGGIFDERNRRGLKNLAEPEVKFISKLIAPRPGPALRDIISNVMHGKGEGADHISEDDEGEKEIQQKRLPARTMMALGRKQDPREDLYEKKVVVVGLGASGRSAVKLALARGADVVAVDKNERMHPLELEEEFARYGPDRLRTELGPHQIKTFMDADKLVVSPGVPLTQPAVAAALESGVAAVSELGFAAEVLPKGIKLAAVTGTNGKSTVTSFTGQILSQAGIRTFVGGNLGTPLCEAAWQCLAFPAKDPPFHAAIVEVSSYQLELPGVFAPTVGVILNLTPDHLERHKTMENYGMIKCRLFSKMSPPDVSVIPWGSSLLRHIAAKSHGASTRAWLGALPGVQLDSQARRAVVVVPTTGAEARLHLERLNIVGIHNAHNVGTAALLALALDIGVDEIHIQSALPELEALPHRMQIVCQDKRGVQWVNDSKATNVEAAFTGIRGIMGKTAVILLGGLGKAGAGCGDLGFSRLVEVLKHHRAVVTFGTSGNKIKEELLAAGITIPLVRVENLSDAVHAAQSMAHSGDTILLSPGCASFDEFSNFEHRGRVFTQLAKQHSSRK